ncbi:hypothetical protein CCACVL1_17319 [Corchorus capsularis]|uniref:Uncharacterized protein n=1 Tax=Corchorus capsularis TaxID=210143 RepID=A0A1R3HT57_COCAP|nr:hypothetical protein CCACVL1_17319 [Corchorus capsularis]
MDGLPSAVTTVNRHYRAQKYH